MEVSFINEALVLMGITIYWVKNVRKNMKSYITTNRNFSTIKIESKLFKFNHTITSIINNNRDCDLYIGKSTILNQYTKYYTCKSKHY